MFVENVEHGNVGNLHAKRPTSGNTVDLLIPTIFKQSYGRFKAVVDKDKEPSWNSCDQSFLQELMANCRASRTKVGLSESYKALSRM